MTQHIAFIGLGNMGGHMAKNLLKKDFRVTVYDLNKSAMASLKEAGAETADNAQSAVKDADVIISMLPNGAIVKSLYIGANGLIKDLSKDVLIIDSSTIAADDARAVAKACEQKGIAMIDAPVSGGTAAAEAGTLTFICGGEQAHFEAAKTVVQSVRLIQFAVSLGGVESLIEHAASMTHGPMIMSDAEREEAWISQGLIRLRYAHTRPSNYVTSLQVIKVHVLYTGYRSLLSCCCRELLNRCHVR